jgi:hypothetical protein
MKAREFRLVPTARKGERRERQTHAPVRPSLLAPLMVEQAKAIALAKELAAMKPADLERELEADPGQRPETVPTTPAVPAVAAQAPASPAPVAKAPTVWEEAAVLRRLLFSANVPVAVAAPAPPSPIAASAPVTGHGGNHGGGGLAHAGAPARVLPRHLRGRRRR